MKYLALLFLVFFVWIVYELWRAPLVDDDGNVIEPTKRLRDLFK